MPMTAPDALGLPAPDDFAEQEDPNLHTYSSLY